MANSVESKPKKYAVRIQQWKKALIHFSLCFVMGFFSGFAPMGLSPRPAMRFLRAFNGSGLNGVADSRILNRTVGAQLSARIVIEPGDDFGFPDSANGSNGDESPRELLIVVTTTTRWVARERRARLMRFAHTLKLVPPPLVWIVVEEKSEVPDTARTLRSTGVMYRHLTYKENFTTFEAEEHHQRNVALGHLERHRLTGIVLFCGLTNSYDLRFFQQLREIEVFGAWMVAEVSYDQRSVAIEGPVCSSSEVLGWISKNFTDDQEVTDTTAIAATIPDSNILVDDVVQEPEELNIFGFGFNSSVLWDPERWGRPTSVPDTSQDSMKYVQEAALEDENKLKCLPADGSQIMLWHYHVPPEKDSRQF